MREDEGKEGCFAAIVRLKLVREIGTVGSREEHASMPVSIAFLMEGYFAISAAVSGSCSMLERVGGVM